MSKVKKLDQLSIFFPAYNEEAHINQTVQQALKIAPQVAKKFEILVINDGSQDRTEEIVNQIVAQHKQVRQLVHSVNSGYGEALKTGFYNTQYDWIVFTDSDGQFDFAEIEQFIRTQQETGADMVIGYYRKRAVSWRRKLNTWVWQQIVGFLFGLRVRDIDCGFKLIHRRVIDQIPRLESGRGAFISSELLIKAQKQGFKIIEIPVTHHPRKAGRGTGADLNVILRSFWDLGNLWWKLR